MLFMLHINVAEKLWMRKKTHLSGLAEQNLALFRFYNTGQCLLRSPAIIMSGVLGFDVMNNDSRGWGGCKSTSVPENKQCHPD